MCFDFGFADIFAYEEKNFFAESFRTKACVLKYFKSYDVTRNIIS